MGGGHSKRSYNFNASPEKVASSSEAAGNKRGSIDKAAQQTENVAAAVPIATATKETAPPKPFVESDLKPVVTSTSTAAASNSSDLPSNTVEISLPMESESDIVEKVLCKADDLQAGDVREFEVEGAKILLVRDKDGSFHAIGGKCTHYGAPLAKGAYSNGRIRCPWHGACFSIFTGDIEDFPGLDSVPLFSVVNNEDGEIVLKTDKAALSSAKRTKVMCGLDPSCAGDENAVVIIGGGGSGLSCAETLRQEGFSGPVIVLSQEQALPYDRPKLSKALDATGESLALRPPEFYAKNSIDIRLNSKVVGIDLTSNSVALSDGSDSIRFKFLVIATGGKPRTLTIPGHDLENVCYLRTPADGNRIAQLAAGKRVAIIGSSFIGMEVACTLAKKAESVTVIGPSPVPFKPVFGEEIGVAIKKLFETNNIHFRLGVNVKELRGTDGKISEIIFSDDSSLATDVCVVGIGVVPSTDFIRAEDLSMDERSFIKVDEGLRTSRENVFACGDIVVFPLSSLQYQVVNVQHWQMALKHGNTAAYSILGKKDRPLRTVPFFWTVLFGKSLRYTGYGVGFQEVVLHGSLEEFKFVAYYLRDNKLVAVATVGRDPVASQIAQLFYNGVEITKEQIDENEADDWQKWL